MAEQETEPGRIYNLRSLLIIAMTHAHSTAHEAQAESDYGTGMKQELIARALQRIKDSEIEIV